MGNERRFQSTNVEDTSSVAPAPAHIRARSQSSGGPFTKEMSFATSGDNAAGINVNPTTKFEKSKRFEKDKFDDSGGPTLHIQGSEQLSRRHSAAAGMLRPSTTQARRRPAIRSQSMAVSSGYMKAAA
jgi:hypothetical protein